MRVLILLALLSTISLFAKEITPYRYVTASEAVSDFVKVEDTLIIGTEEGIIDIYDLKSDKVIDQVMLPKVKDLWGDYMRPIIYSVDYLEGKILFISRLFSGIRELYLYEDKVLTKLIDESKKFTLKEAKFIDADTAIIGMMSNELMLFDLKNKKIIYKKQLNQASLSDIALSEDRKYIFTADESPLLYKIEIKSGNIVEEYRKGNKRDIFSIDYKNGLLMSGGKDKRAVIYKSPLQYKMAKADFFIYSVALSPDGKKAAFVKNEQGDISIINTNGMKEHFLLKGHKQTIIKMDFHKPDELISADEDNRLMFWKLQE